MSDHVLVPSKVPVTMSTLTGPTNSTPDVPPDTSVWPRSAPAPPMTAPCGQSVYHRLRHPRLPRPAPISLCVRDFSSGPTHKYRRAPTTPSPPSGVSPSRPSPLSPEPSRAAAPASPPCCDMRTHAGHEVRFPIARTLGQPLSSATPPSCRPARRGRGHRYDLPSRLIESGGSPLRIGPSLRAVHEHAALSATHAPPPDRWPMRLGRCAPLRDLRRNRQRNPRTTRRYRPRATPRRLSRRPSPFLTKRNPTGPAADRRFAQMNL